MADLQTLLLPPLLALALCVHLGYAFAGMALPPDLQPYRALLTPLAGCALFLVVTATLTTLTALTPPLIAAGLAALPGNPLVAIFSAPPVSGRIHAFSYLQAAVSSGTIIEPLRSYAPMMAFVLALQPLAVYPLARVLGLARGAALLATTLLALAW